MTDAVPCEIHSLTAPLFSSNASRVSMTVESGDTLRHINGLESSDLSMQHQTHIGSANDYDDAFFHDESQCVDSGASTNLPHSFSEGIDSSNRFTPAFVAPSPSSSNVAQSQSLSDSHLCNSNMIGPAVVVQHSYVDSGVGSTSFVTSTM